MAGGVSGGGGGGGGGEEVTVKPAACMSSLFSTRISVSVSMSISLRDKNVLGVRNEKSRRDHKRDRLHDQTVKQLTCFGRNCQ